MVRCVPGWVKWLPAVFWCARFPPLGYARAQAYTLVPSQDPLTILAPPQLTVFCTLFFAVHPHFLSLALLSPCVPPFFIMRTLCFQWCCAKQRLLGDLVSSSPCGASRRHGHEFCGCTHHGSSLLHSPSSAALVWSGVQCTIQHHHHHCLDILQ